MSARDFGTTLDVLMDGRKIGEFKEEGEKKIDLMLRVEFPKNKVFDAKNYIKPCGECKKQGWIEKDCRKCAGSGECDRCEGTGRRTSLDGGRSIQKLSAPAAGRIRIGSYPNKRMTSPMGVMSRK